MSFDIVDLLETVVKQAWKEEKAFGKSIFGREPKDNDSLCQGISRNVFHKIFGCFPNSTMLKFEVNGKSHIVIHTTHFLESYVIDGTIKQFRPREPRTVFPRNEYPFKSCSSAQT